MKIAVVNNMIPFVRGGAEELADYLVHHLLRRGHEVDLVRIPFRYEPADRIYDEMTACRLMRIDDADMVIALKFPAYLIDHPKKVLWLVHQYRQAYDMWDSGHSNIPDSIEGKQLRHSIGQADAECFRGVRRLCAISPIVQQRLKKFNGFASELLRTPINGPEDFTEGPYGDYLFCGGRINATKRQHLLVEAMQFVRSPAKLLIAGPADTDADSCRIKALIEKFGLADRVRLEVGFHPRPKIAEWVSHCLAVAYLPIDEDSLGYVSMEANQAGKAVITSDDSGGLLDLVVDGETGWVVPAEPRQVAAAIDEAFDKRSRTQELGNAARGHWLSMGITWERTVERLVA
jgi:glycosyltransferase involved in cell wall biosynthesis